MAYKQLKLWFDADLAKDLSSKLSTLSPQFKTRSFVHAVTKQIEPLELKDRVEIFADELYHHLGQDYKSGLKSLTKILGPENEEETGMFKKYYWIMPIAKYVEKYGLDDFDLSMQAIEEITKRNTGEYTIRPYLETMPSKTLSIMRQWSKNPTNMSED